MSEDQKKTSERTSILKEYGEALLWAVILVIIIRTFVLQAYSIPSGSMLNTLLIGDHLIGTKYDCGVKIPFTDTYIWKGSDPEVGDIIIFEYPEDPKTNFIKRVIGVPGDTIEIRSKHLYRNGVLVDEPYVRFENPEESNRAIRDNYGPITLGPGKFFMMGDNRDNSHDSRFWGPLDRSGVIAKALFIYWSKDPDGGVRWSRTGRYLRNH